MHLKWLDKFSELADFRRIRSEMLTYKVSYVDLVDKSVDKSVDNFRKPL